MKKITKTFNDTNSSNLTACTEDNNQSNGDSILENTNDILFTPVHEFILNKTIVKKSKNVHKKKSSNKTFYLQSHSSNKEWEDINMEKWHQNRIKISKDLKNQKRNIYRLLSDDKIKSRAHQLTAEKGKGIYTIRNDIDIIGKIKWNIFSNHFKVYDDKDNLIEEIIYSFNFKGWNGPTKLITLNHGIKLKIKNFYIKLKISHPNIMIFSIFILLNSLEGKSFQMKKICN